MRHGSSDSNHSAAILQALEVPLAVMWAVRAADVATVLLVAMLVETVASGSTDLPGCRRQPG